MLAPLVDIALKVSKLRERTGRTGPTVITWFFCHAASTHPQQQDTSALLGVKLPFNAVLASVVDPLKNWGGWKTETQQAGYQKIHVEHLIYVALKVTHWHILVLTQSEC